MLIVFQFSTSSVSCRSLRFSRHHTLTLDSSPKQVMELTAQLHAVGMRPLPPGFSSSGQSFNSITCSIPKFVHQTWKTNRIPISLAKYVRTWVDVGGVSNAMQAEWKYFFWTDKMNRHFVATRYPQYLDVYDRFPQGIMRADMIRYLILYEFGGTYVDLDFEALRSLNEILNDLDMLPSSSKGQERPSCVLGQEPPEHAHVLYKVSHLVCNAIMLSCPGHPFWMDVVDLVVKRSLSGNFSGRVLKLTGPMVVQAALDKRLLSSTNDVYLAPSELFYPDVDYTNENLRNNCNRDELKKRCDQGISQDISKRKRKKALPPEACARRRATCETMRKEHFSNKKRDRKNSWATHHWKHSWLPGYQLNQEANGMSSASSAWSKKCSEIDVSDVVGSAESFEKAKQRCGYNNGGIDSTSSSSNRWKSSKNLNKYSTQKMQHKQQHQNKPRSSIPESCVGDRKRLCSDMKPGKGRTHNCLRKYRAKLSEKCRSKMKFEK